MRDIHRAERLLALFTTPDSAAGIAGDLSEERGQRGRVWFWRQVLGTAFFLCRGALFASPVVVLLLVALGLVLSIVASLVTSVATVNLFNLGPTDALQIFLTSALFRGLCTLIVGGTLVTASPRLGMVACTLLAGLHVMVSLASAVYVLANLTPFWWLIWIVGLVTPVLLLLGGVMVRRRQNGRILRAAD
jgi:hypothetical protein